MFYERIIEKTLRSTDKTFPVPILTGPRQVGKTRLLQKRCLRTTRYPGGNNAIALFEPSANC